MESPSEVEVDGVAAEDAAFAEVAEFGVGDRAGGVNMVHGVAADAGGVGGLEDDVASEEGNFATVIALALVVEHDGFVEDELVAEDGRDGAFFGLAVVSDGGDDFLLAVADAEKAE